MFNQSIRGNALMQNLHRARQPKVITCWIQTHNAYLIMFPNLIRVTYNHDLGEVGTKKGPVLPTMELIVAQIFMVGLRRALQYVTSVIIFNLCLLNQKTSGDNSTAPHSQHSKIQLGVNTWMLCTIRYSPHNKVSLYFMLNIKYCE